MRYLTRPLHALDPFGRPADSCAGILRRSAGATPRPRRAGGDERALGPVTSSISRFRLLLFDVIAHAGAATRSGRPGFIAAFGLAAVICFALTVAVRLRQGSGLADAAVDGLNGAGRQHRLYTGKFPLALAAFGAGSQAPVLIATILTVCFVFALAIVLIEIGLQKRAAETA